MLMFIKLSNILLTAYPSFDEVVSAEKKYYELLQNHWKHYEFLTYSWWFLVILTIIPPLIWWILLDKQRSFEVITYGLFLGMIATILDSIGSINFLWVYPVRLTPYFYPQYYPYDVSLVIIPFMLVYQKFPTIKKFTISVVLVSAFIAFLAEPFMAWIGVYEQLKWEHIYSFFIYILISLFCKLITIFLKKKSLGGQSPTTLKR